MTPDRRRHLLVAALLATVAWVALLPDADDDDLRMAGARATPVPETDALPAVLPLPRRPRVAAPEPLRERTDAQATPGARRAARPVPAPPPVVAPVLPPMRWIGRFESPQETVVFVALGGRTLDLRIGSEEGGFRLVAIGPDAIEFEHLATATHQFLRIPPP